MNGEKNERPEKGESRRRRSIFSPLFIVESKKSEWNESFSVSFYEDPGQAPSSSFSSASRLVKAEAADTLQSERSHLHIRIDWDVRYSRPVPLLLSAV